MKALGIKDGKPIEFVLRRLGLVFDRYVTYVGLPDGSDHTLSVDRAIVDRRAHARIEQEQGWLRDLGITDFDIIGVDESVIA